MGNTHIKNDGLNTWFDMLLIAKTLEPKGGRTTILSKLRENGYLMEGNMPYQQYVDSGHFKMELRPNTKKGETVQWYAVTLASLKGIELIKRIIKESELALIKTAN